MGPFEGLESRENLLGGLLHRKIVELGIPQRLF